MEDHYNNLFVSCFLMCLPLCQDKGIILYSFLFYFITFSRNLQVVGTVFQTKQRRSMHRQTELLSVYRQGGTPPTQSSVFFCYTPLCIQNSLPGLHKQEPQGQPSLPFLPSSTTLVPKELVLVQLHAGCLSQHVVIVQPHVARVIQQEPGNPSQGIFFSPFKENIGLYHWLILILDYIRLILIFVYIIVG